MFWFSLQVCEEELQYHFFPSHPQGKFNIRTLPSVYQGKMIYGIYLAPEAETLPAAWHSWLTVNSLFGRLCHKTDTNPHPQNGPFHSFGSCPLTAYLSHRPSLRRRPLGPSTCEPIQIARSLWTITEYDFVIVNPDKPSQCISATPHQLHLKRSNFAIIAACRHARSLSLALALTHGLRLPSLFWDATSF